MTKTEIILAQRVLIDRLAAAGWPEGGLTAVPHCPVCCCPKRSILHEGLTDRTFFCAPGRWTLYRCERCQSGYLDPRPSDDTLGQAYVEYYTHNGFPEENNANVQLAAGFRQELRDGYENFRFGTKHERASALGIPVGHVWPRMRWMIEARNYFLTNRPKRVLDVGFGSGRFLKTARDNGWNPVGVDLDPVSVKQARARGFEVYQGDIKSMAARGETFDAVTMSHVIEHVPDPESVIEVALSLLNPGGMIYLDTPNLDAQGHAAFGPYWRDLDPPRHLVLFTWKSLEGLVSRAGFKRLKRHRRPYLTRQIWQESRYVQEGVPLGSIELGECNVPLLSRLKPYFRIAAQEFVTVTAVKP